LVQWFAQAITLINRLTKQALFNNVGKG